ncbi:hypothetical protein [Myxosarcina sp. GI1(2024)]
MKLATLLNKHQKSIAVKNRSPFTKKVVENSSREVRLNEVYGINYTQTTIPDLFFTTASGRRVLVFVIDGMNANTRNKLLAIEKQKKEVLNNMTRGRDAKKDVEIRILFKNGSRRVRRDTNTTYLEWAEGHCFRCEEGDSIPTSWLME